MIEVAEPPKGLRIIRLNAHNLKRLTAVDITPRGSVVQITGPNGSGKSSVLDAIYFALSGERGIDPQPIRTGEKRARVRLDLGEFIVTRQWTEGGTSLKVESEDGKTKYPSPQKLLDDLLGSLTFDPLEFSRMDAPSQARTLQVLAGLGGLEAFDVRAKEAYDKRTEVNRQVNSLTERIALIDSEIDKKMDCTLVDVGALLQKMQDAAEVNSTIERRKLAQEADHRTLQDAKGRVTDAENAIAALLEQKERYEEDVRLVERAIAAHTPLEAPVEISILKRDVQEAQAANASREKQTHVRAQRDHIVVEAQAAQATSHALTDEIDNAKREKREKIAAAAFPVDGLLLGEDGQVLYRGLPFEQASSAEQLRVSVAIAMAANPKLKVLRVKDGSLLDDHSLKLISEMVELADYQLWIERVDTSGLVGIVMQDGGVVAVDGVAVGAVFEPVGAA